MQGSTRSESVDRLGTTLLGVAKPMLPQRPSLTAIERSQVEADLAFHLSAQIRSMPIHLRIPVAIALYSFEFLPLVRSLKTFGSTSPATQIRIISRWNHSPIPQFRDLIKLVRSCSLLAYLDHPVVRQRLESEARGG